MICSSGLCKNSKPNILFLEGWIHFGLTWAHLEDSMLNSKNILALFVSLYDARNILINRFWKHYINNAFCYTHIENTIPITWFALKIHNISKHVLNFEYIITYLMFCLSKCSIIRHFSTCHVTAKVPTEPLTNLEMPNVIVKDHEELHYQIQNKVLENLCDQWCL
jgi:hypothetical protein